MVKNQVLSILLTMGLCIPSYGILGQTIPEQANNYRIEQLKKVSKLAGYGVLTAAGIGIMCLNGLVSFGQLALDPANKPSKDAIDNASGCNKNILRIKHMITPHPLPNGADFTKKLSHKGSVLVGIGAMSGLGLGLTFFGVRGIQKTLGQTVEEKEAQEESDEKIKQTIKDTGRVAFDISRRSVRVAAYSLITTIGATATLSAISLGLRAFTHEKESIFSKKGYQSMAMEHAKSKIKSLIGASILAPLGLGIFAYGLRGVKKEYYSWKESKTRQDIVSVVQSMKDKLEEKVEGAIDIVANTVANQDAKKSEEEIGVKDEKI